MSEKIIIKVPNSKTKTLEHNTNYKFEIPPKSYFPLVVEFDDELNNEQQCIISNLKNIFLNFYLKTPNDIFIDVFVVDRKIDIQHLASNVSNFAEIASADVKPVYDSDLAIRGTIILFNNSTKVQTFEVMPVLTDWNPVDKTASVSYKQI